MGDAPRPSDAAYQQVLQESLKTWSSYLSNRDNDLSLPRQSIDLQSLVSGTPSFLGDGLVPHGEMISLRCEEKASSLVMDGRSTWRISKGICDLLPIVLPKQLLLCVGSDTSVRLLEDAPLAEWPGVKGLEGYDSGNYLAVLYFAWAYILSARWIELLSRSADHECWMEYNAPGLPAAPQSNDRPAIQIDLGYGVSPEEVSWWHTILSSNDCWSAATKYNGHVYLSPWSVSVKEVGLTVFPEFPTDKGPLPSSSVALNYLTRFCKHYKLYAQCTVALAGALLIPFPRNKPIPLPFPKPLSREDLTAGSMRVPLATIDDLIKAHKGLLPKYMTLSSNPWGIRSLLASTYFNPDIECNLVSAWLNPAFAMIDWISSTSPASVATLLSQRRPQLGILWLGALCVHLAKPVLSEIRCGLVALDLAASAWTEVPQTFLTSPMHGINDESIRRDDECRLLFITASKRHERPPVWPWKAFGATQLCNTELTVREHAHCAATHCLEYQSWEWLLLNNSVIPDFAKKDNGQMQNIVTSSPLTTTQTGASPKSMNFDCELYSDSQSKSATRGIFMWLRSTGYSERKIDISAFLVRYCGL